MKVKSTDDIDSQELLRSHGLNEEDLEQVRRFGALAAPNVDKFIDDFYTWLEPWPEFQRFFSDQATLERVKAHQKAYWLEFLRARVDIDYIRRRREVGEVHARISLPVRTYFAAMDFALAWFSDCLREQDVSPEKYVATFQSLTKLVHLDIAVVVGALSERGNEIIAAQSRSLLDLSTPVIELWDEIILLPLVGVIDTQRAQHIIESLLNGIVKTQSRVAILDVTGVPVIDTSVGQHLLRTVAAAKMLGAEVVLTGISPNAAGTFVKLNIDLSSIRTRGTLQGGIAEAFTLTGKQIVPS